MNFELFKIYAFKFFDDFVLIYPFYTILFTDKGISPAQIGILLGVWSTTSFLLDVPTGVIADRYSRKHILFFAQVLRAIGYLIWLLYPTFWGFLIGFILWGIKSAFTSGTFQGLLYDRLKEDGQEKDYAKISGRAKTFSYTGNLSAAAVASVAITTGYPLVLGASAAAVIVAGFCTLLLKPTTQSKLVEEFDYWGHLKKGIRAVLQEQLIFKLIIFVAIVHALGDALDEYFPIFASLTAVSKSGIAIFIGAMSATEAMASYFAHKLENLSLRSLYVVFGLTGVIFAWASAMLNISSLVLLCLYSGIYVIVSVLVETKLQHLFPHSVRATATSVQGFFVEIGVLVIYFGFGASAQSIGYAKSFEYAGIPTIIIAVVYLIFSLSRRQPEAQYGQR